VRITVVAGGGVVSAAGGVEGGGAGSIAQPATSIPTIAATMWLIVLEALGALALLVFIVWWTMFSGRKKGERRDRD
jgi:hypothetical protein